jgi:hypothetical protein
MVNHSLLKLGAISAFAFVGLFTISIAAYWVTGGLEFRAWVPLFSSLVCCWFIATIVAYDILAKAEYALARVGFGFAILSIMVLLLEAVVWGADRMVLRASNSSDQPTLTELRALFDSLHVMVLWLIGIWYAFWGVGFFRLVGKARIAGVAMILVAVFHFGDYVLYRVEGAASLAEYWHLGSQGFNLIAYVALGLHFLDVSRSMRTDM